MENENPVVYERLPDRIFKEEDFQRGQLPIDAREVFGKLKSLDCSFLLTVPNYIRDILDPEHPMTLEELKVVQLELIQVDDENNYCAVQFVPTITHCSLATLIGLSIKVQLMRLLPARFKIDVSIVPGTYVSVDAANKQLADKERVTAALENDYLRETINISLMDEISQTLPKFVEEALRKTDKLNHPKVLYIQNSRQHIESYRRWYDIIYSDEKNWKSSLSFNKH